MLLKFMTTAKLSPKIKHAQFQNPWAKKEKRK